MYAANGDVASGKGRVKQPAPKCDRGCGRPAAKAEGRSAGRPMAYCSPACRQRAYRARGGRASGTTGAERQRRARQDPAAR